MEYMTLTQFRETGRSLDAAELERITGCDLTGNTHGGRLYAGNTYIERCPNKLTGRLQWQLDIMHSSWTGSLRTLEALLYSFCRTEVFQQLETGEAEFDALVEEWRTFCADEGLWHVSADEAVTLWRRDNQQQLTPAVESYVLQFNERWDRMVQRRASDI